MKIIEQTSCTERGDRVSVDKRTSLARPAWSRAVRPRNDHHDPAVPPLDAGSARSPLGRRDPQCGHGKDIALEKELPTRRLPVFHSAPCPPHLSIRPKTHPANPG